MSVNSIKKVTLPSQVWNMAMDEKERALYLDIRDKEKISLVKLNVENFSFEQKNLPNSWWTKLIEARGERLTFVEYLDEQNPNKHNFFSLNWEDLERIELEAFQAAEGDMIMPYIYEKGSDYQKTVSEFLALDLPLSCEYLEWNDKIIISYYLRSGNGFDRYLLLLKKGNKEWKLLQDTQVHGFSSGAFFVFSNQLIFIKDQNEVCVYSL